MILGLLTGWIIGIGCTTPSATQSARGGGNPGPPRDPRTAVSPLTLEQFTTMIEFHTKQKLTVPPDIRRTVYIVAEPTTLAWRGIPFELSTCLGLSVRRVGDKALDLYAGSALPTAPRPIGAYSSLVGLKCENDRIIVGPPPPPDFDSSDPAAWDAWIAAAERERLQRHHEKPEAGVHLHDTDAMRSSESNLPE